MLIMATTWEKYYGKQCFSITCRDLLCPSLVFHLALWFFHISATEYCFSILPAIFNQKLYNIIYYTSSYCIIGLLLRHLRGHYTIFLYALSYGLLLYIYIYMITTNFYHGYCIWLWFSFMYRICNRAAGFTYIFMLLPTSCCLRLKFLSQHILDVIINGLFSTFSLAAMLGTNNYHHSIWEIGKDNHLHVQWQDQVFLSFHGEPMYLGSWIFIKWACKFSFYQYQTYPLSCV